MKSKINWYFTGYHISYTLFLIFAVPIYLSFKAPPTGIIITAVILYFATMLGITAGYHRFYSHKSYKAHPILEMILIALATLTIQGSAKFWAYTHRVHHRYTDTEKDPHNIKKGFWYAHMGWFLVKQKENEKNKRYIDETLIEDLTKNKITQFQDRYYLPLAFGLNAIVTLITGILFNDIIAAFIFVWWLRILIVNHCVWLINSLAHTLGHKTHLKNATAVDNIIMSILTLGEGYHNYHHAFPRDYRNGHRWYHLDPTKWAIFFFYKIGLAQKLNTPKIIKQSDRNVNH